MRAVLFGSAEIKDYSICRQYIMPDDIIICCDGGMNHTKQLNIIPNYILGDFDSVKSEVFQYYQELGIKIQQFPTQKDETDMQLGLNFAVELGADDIIIFGGIGSRFDHTLANAHLLLRLLKKQVRGRLINEHNCIEVIDKPTKFYGKAGDLISIIPLSMEVSGITLCGMKYPLHDKRLTIDDDLIAVSNVMLEDEVEVKIKEGYLFVIQTKE